jgi:hypothetical protein
MVPDKTKAAVTNGRVSIRMRDVIFELVGSMTMNGLHPWRHCRFIPVSRL